MQIYTNKYTTRYNRTKETPFTVVKKMSKKHPAAIQGHVDLNGPHYLDSSHRLKKITDEMKNVWFKNTKESHKRLGLTLEKMSIDYCPISSRVFNEQTVWEFMEI